MRTPFPVTGDPRLHAFWDAIIASMDYLSQARHISRPYPYVSRLLFKLIAGPLSSGRLEGMFNVAGMQQRNGRSRLGIDTLNALLVARLRQDEFRNSMTRALELWRGNQHWGDHVRVRHEDGGILEGVPLVDELPSQDESTGEVAVDDQAAVDDEAGANEDFEAHNVDFQSGILAGEAGREQLQHLTRDSRAARHTGPSTIMPKVLADRLHRAALALSIIWSPTIVGVATNQFRLRLRADCFAHAPAGPKQRRVLSCGLACLGKTYVPAAAAILLCVVCMFRFRLVPPVSGANGIGFACCRSAGCSCVAACQ